MKRYSPPASTVLRLHTIARRPDGRVQDLEDVARIAGTDFWGYVDYVFPGCDRKTACVNWYLRHRLNCGETHDRMNRIFKGGEQLPIPKLSLSAAPILPMVPGAPSARPLKPGHYDRAAAAAYALKHYATNSFNPAYGVYLNDCTNFVSQAMHAGGWPMIGGSVYDYNDDTAWWYGKVSKADYDSVVSQAIDGMKDLVRGNTPPPDALRYQASHSWAGADGLRRHLQISKRAEQSTPDKMQPGDVVQILDAPNHAAHTMIVTRRLGPDDFEYAQHSDNKIDTYQNRLASRNHADLIFWKVKDTLY